MPVKPFEIAIPQADLDDLRERLSRTRWPVEIGDNSQWQAGTNLAYMRELTDYWLNQYDWRAREREMNALPQFRTTIDGVPIHFVHAKGKGPNPLPLVINHGWPWTFWDMRKIIGPLSDPAAHGGDPADAFDVICPSLPGYAFSSPLTVPDFYFTQAGDLYVKLMDELGYDKFGTQGGDIGSALSTMLGHRHPDRVLGVHLHLLIPLGGNNPQPDDFTEAEAAGGAKLMQYHQDGSGYMHIQRTRPQTIAYAMNDSPVGQAAWMVEKRRAWADTGGDIESVWSKDELIDNAMLYWLTQTYLSSASYYSGPGHTGMKGDFLNDQLPLVSVPTGVMQFEGDVWTLPRKWAERMYNIASWKVEKHGGHFAPAERPDLLVGDLRQFFRQFRQPE